MPNKKSKKNKITLKKNRKKQLYFSAFISCFLFFFILGFCIFRFFLSHDSQLPQSIQTKALDIRALDKRFTDLVKNKDPKVALEALRGMLSDDRVANVCHSLAHNIGHEAYLTYGDFAQAMEYNDEICGSGYIHGLVEERMSHVTDLSKDLDTVCAPQNSGICFHGVGHGFMYFTINNLHLSLASCDSLAQEYQVNNCYDGVFMENYEGNRDLHPTKYTNVDNPSYPCDSLKDTYKESCYFYSVRYFLQVHPRNYTRAFTWCRTLEEGYRLTCIKGVGSAVMKENLNEPNITASLCERTENATEKAYCIDGMVSYYVTNYYSISAGETMCNSLAYNKNLCLNSVRRRITMFPS